MNAQNVVRIPCNPRDAEHERRIADAQAALLAAKTPDERRKYADTMRALINARSAQQIRRMEHARGIA